jgi:hypothetical protein
MPFLTTELQKRRLTGTKKIANAHPKTGVRSDIKTFERECLNVRPDTSVGGVRNKLG